MRIGYFTSIAGWGGSEIYLRDIARAIESKGHEVVVFGVGGSRLFEELAGGSIELVEWTTRKPEMPEDAAHPAARRKTLAHEWRGALYRYIAPPSMKLFAGVWQDARKLAALLKSAHLDILHVNANGYEFAVLAARRLGIPVLLMQHAMPVREALWGRRVLTHYMISRADAMVSVSRACGAAWDRTTKNKRVPSFWIHHGVDVPPSGLSMKREGICRSAEVRMASAGRLHRMKGFESLIAAMALVADVPVRLDIFGGGDLRETLQSKIDTLGLGGRVVLKGHVEDLNERLLEYDLFALVSVSSETFGLSLAEAMAVGLPAITSDYGPLPEINLHGETGLVVPAGNAPVLGAAIRLMAGDAKLRARMGAAARKRIATYFARSRMVRQTEQAYEALLSGAIRSFAQTMRQEAEAMTEQSNRAQTNAR